MANSKVKKLHRRRNHQRKLHYWRRRLARTKDMKERELIIAKIRQMSPRAPIADYLAAR